MADAPPIPRDIWERIVAWLNAGGTGRITIEADRGQVRDAWINERIRAQRLEDQPRRAPDATPGV